MKFRVITTTPGHGFKLGAIVEAIRPDPVCPEHLTDYQLVTADTLRPDFLGHTGTRSRYTQALEACDVEQLKDTP